MAPPDSVRARIVGQLADMIASIERPHPVRVAIDGRSGAGKSTLSDELVIPLRQRHRTTIRASIDDFYGLWLDKHNRSSLTAETFYSGAYDFATLRSLLLGPRPVPRRSFFRNSERPESSQHAGLLRARHRSCMVPRVRPE